MWNSKYATFCVKNDPQTLQKAPKHFVDQFTAIRGQFWSQNLHVWTTLMNGCFGSRLVAAAQNTASEFSRVQYKKWPHLFFWHLRTGFRPNSDELCWTPPSRGHFWATLWNSKNRLSHSTAHFWSTFLKVIFWQAFGHFPDSWARSSADFNLKSDPLILLAS